MEVWEVSITIKSWWLLRFRKIEVAEDKKSLAVPIAAIGLLIIVAGFVLETYCEGKVANAETELRNHFSDKIVGAEYTSSLATKDAGDARTETARLQSITQGLETEAADARRDMVAAQLELARLKGPVNIIHPSADGTAQPDLTKSLIQQILLKRDLRIHAPVLPPLGTNGTITWTLFLDQNNIGSHQYTFEFMRDVQAYPGLVPNSRAAFEFVTEANGRTTMRGIPIVDMPNSTTTKKK